jgi:hypothetical protein
MDKHISSNQFVEFDTKKTEKGKLRILSQQKIPNPFLTPWYQRAKSCFRKSLRAGGDLIPIFEGIEILQNRVPINKRQLDDKDVSIQALRRYCEMKLPKFILDKNFEVVKLNQKVVRIKGLDISPSPELVFKFVGLNGDTIFGAIKVHISKRKPFSLQSAELSSTLLYNYLKDVLDKDSIVDPSFCFTIDIFGDRIVPAPLNVNEYNLKVYRICEEIVQLWDVA